MFAEYCGQSAIKNETELEKGGRLAFPEVQLYVCQILRPRAEERDRVRRKEEGCIEEQPRVSKRLALTVAFSGGQKHLPPRRSADSTQHYG